MRTLEIYPNPNSYRTELCLALADIYNAEMKLKAANFMEPGPARRKVVKDAEKALKKAHAARRAAAIPVTPQPTPS